MFFYDYNKQLLKASYKCSDGLQINRSDEGLTLETSAKKLFTVDHLHYQLIKPNYLVVLRIILTAK